jgi:hypothetical protein
LVPFGTATGVAASGTEEEIRRAMKLGRRVMVYFSSLEPIPTTAKMDQLEKLWKFRQEIQSEGLCWKFSSRDQFRKEFSRHLSLKLNEFRSVKDAIKEKSSSKNNQSIVGDGNLQAGGDINVFTKPSKIVNKVETPPGSVSPSELKRIQSWVEELAEGTVGMSRQSAYGMWGARIKTRFDVAKREQLLSSQMHEVEQWFRQQRAIRTRGLKSKDPNEFKKKRIGAIKAAMNQMGVTKEVYYPQLAKRLRMKKPFSSLKDLTKSDLERVCTMVMRDAGGR